MQNFEIFAFFWRKMNPYRCPGVGHGVSGVSDMDNRGEIILVAMLHRLVILYFCKTM